MTKRVLFVDDEQRILDAMRRTLRGKYSVETAISGEEALALLQESLSAGDPFAVIVSDMMMPGMNGAEFLRRAREVLPDAVRLILSGQADLTSTIAAVNNANLFRFLTKPVDPRALTTALDDALGQHDLVVSERELLQKTLTGAVEVLTEVLTLASPLASRRTARMRALVDTAGTLLRLDDWRLPVAAMLSQIGCIAVPAPTLERVEAAVELSPAEERMFLGHPALARQLITRIPRLEEIADWIGDQVTDFERMDGPVLSDPSESLFIAVTAYLAGYDANHPPLELSRRLEDCGRFSQRIVDAITDAADQELTPRGVLRQLRTRDLRAGMVLDMDVKTSAGLVLVRKGERITGMMAARLLNFAHSVGVQEPISVWAPK